MKLFFAKVWAWVRKYLLAPLPALLVVGLGLLAVVLGFKNVRIGGLLGKLFGKPEGKTAVEVANGIPADRVDGGGKVIPPGTPDSQGVTQAVVVPVETGGLFSDPTVIKVIPPGETKPVIIHLPDGVKDKDVHQVVIVSPEVVTVTVKDTSKVTVKKVDDLLSKYKA
jgi:hypothetical protein